MENSTNVNILLISEFLNRQKSIMGEEEERKGGGILRVEKGDYWVRFLVDIFRWIYIVISWLCFVVRKRR